MSCEKYRKAITEALASDEELPASVRSHVDGCPLCRVAFAQEEVLLTAIDKRIRDAVDCEVPGSFQAVVRARMREQAMPKPNWTRTWAAVAASAALILGIVLARNARHSEVSHSKQPALVGSHPPQPNIQPLTDTSPREAGGPKIIRRRRRKMDQRQSGAFVGQARPLVPAGQRRAVDELISRLQSGKLKGEILLPERWNGQIEDLQIPPIEIPPLPVGSTDEASLGID